MNREIELKFAVEDSARVRHKVESLGGRFGPASSMEDVYYLHPCRNFAATDEALRLRRDGESVCITYKGPRTLGPVSKSRDEIELGLSGANSLATGRALLERLGFNSLIAVKKRRSTAQISWQNHPVTVSIDEVEGLGTFVELEQLIALSPNDADPASVGSPAYSNIGDADQRILALASFLSLSHRIDSSYLQLSLQLQQTADR